MILTYAAALFVTTWCAAALAQIAPATPAYKNPALPPEQRAADLVGRMTLDEKVPQLVNGAPAIPRLDVPAYNYWNEGLHGVARAGYATMFPQAIGMAATWDAPLLHSIGDVIATEARAKNSEALRRDHHAIYFGLTFWSPNINIFRDPRWGRGQETYGEDPYLTGILGMNFIRGLQGEDRRFYKVIATPKHFAVHSGPESERHRFNVDPSPHDLWDTYLPQFRMAIVDAKAGSIMCAYNALQGQPACGSRLLLGDVLRSDWKFQGFVTSDCGAIDDFFHTSAHHTEPDAEHADRAALLAGTDTNCGSTYAQLGSAVRAGLVTEAELDRSLERLFEARMRLGLFDPPATVPYAQIPFSAVHSAGHVALAKRAAEESIVLLKNDGVLPLVPGKYARVAVIGPDAAALAPLLGNYYGTPHDPTLPLDAVKAALPGSSVFYEPGAPLVDGFPIPVPRTLLHPSAGSNVQGLQAEYFAGPDLTGVPARSILDPQVDFDWDLVNPLAQTGHGFSVRWTGVLRMPRAGTYSFNLRGANCRGCAQSFRVAVDGDTVASSDRPAGAQSSFTLTFAEGQERHVVIEFRRTADERGSGFTLEFTPTPGLLLPAALEAARHSDLVVAILGLSPLLEGEEMSVHLAGFAGGDRTDISLPAAQEQLLAQLAALGKPLVVVLLNGSALAVNFANAHAQAVLEAWYPGEAGAAAIASTLTGANNPSGRLPVTFYRSINDLPAFTDYAMKDRTYRYFTGQPLYGFGFGLSYTHFAYGKVKLSHKLLHAGETLTAEVAVKNADTRAGEEVVELYLVPPASGNGGLSPKLQLAGFQRIALLPGENRTVQFSLDPRALSEVDAQGVRAVQPGQYRVAIGGSQPADPRAPTPAHSASFAITGTQVLPR